MKKQYVIEVFKNNKWEDSGEIFDTLEEAIENKQKTPNPDKLKIRIIEETISRCIVSQ